MSTNKRKLHHSLRLLRKVHYFWLIGLCIIFSIIALFALRSNNKQMVVLRTAVFNADKNNGDTETALKTLRQFVFTHMNTNLASGANAVKPPIQLKYRYERLVASEKATYDAANAKVVADAEATCVAQFPNVTFSQDRLNCARAYAAAHPVTLKSVPDDLYKYDFVSPVWSPDQAGWSLLAAGLFLLLFIVRFLSDKLMVYELKNDA